MLFITDQHFAIVRNMLIFGLRDAITTVELPCEEGHYQFKVRIISATNSYLLS